MDESRGKVPHDPSALGHQFREIVMHDALNLGRGETLELVDEIDGLGKALWMGVIRAVENVLRADPQATLLR